MSWKKPKWARWSKAVRNLSIFGLIGLILYVVQAIANRNWYDSWWSQQCYLVWELWLYVLGAIVIYYLYYLLILYVLWFKQMKQ